MPRWTIDPDHSVAAFSVRHLQVSQVRGQFNSISGTIIFDPSDIPGSSVELSIDLASLTTGIRKRDEHLLSPDFFDAGKHPEITFRSAGAERLEENRGRVTGDLTIHGVTRRIALDVDFSGPVTAPFGGEITMGFSTETIINREEFGILWNVPLDGGGVMVGREVRLFIDLEADLAEGQ